jgi:Dyp-type peroxidase family
LPALTSEQQHNIQGLGLAGFRKDHQELIGVRFGTAEAGKRFIGRSAGRVATLWEVRHFNRLFSEIRRRTNEEGIVEASWRALLISHKGLQVLGADTGGLPEGEGANAFVAGMAQRSTQIGDTREGDAPTQWLEPFRPGAGLDAMVVLAADSIDDLDDAVRDTERLIENAGCERAWSERGNTLRGALTGHEHFGFKDGISQPTIKDFDPDPAEGEPAAVAVGEFVLGYPDETGQAVEVGEIWEDGSFVVFRRLYQDVAAFRAQVATTIPDADPPISPEQLAAKEVGRWPSGAPTELNPDADPGGEGVTNAFQYGADADGLNTPRFAHIRKANPRDETRPDPGDPVQRHRMIRRGIPFGHALAEDATEDDGAQRGLHFVSVVADLDRQFEFVQRKWLNDPNFPNGGAPAGPGDGYQPPAPGVPPDGPDPVVGEHDDPGVPVALHQPGGVRSVALAAEVVRVTAGEYFFAPSVRALKLLAGD